MSKTAQSKEETIGFHKGSLSTLAKEREELAKMLNIVEQLMQMHIKELKDLGVDLVEQAKQMKQESQNSNNENNNSGNGSEKKSSFRQLDELL